MSDDMDEATLLAALRRYWEYAAIDQEIAHEIYHDDAVLEFPQSQERFEGKANFIAWRKIYPASVEFKIRRIRGWGDFWVVEISISYDGGAWNYGCSILEFRGDKIARETIYFSQGWEAPQWRAAWKDESLG
jgi:SnoaL-like domain